MGLCFSTSFAEEPKPPAVVHQTQYVERTVYDPPKASAPPMVAQQPQYPPQGYTYAVRSPQQQSQMPPWATQIYQYPAPYQPSYQVAYPQYTVAQSPVRQSNGMGVAGGMVAGMMIASALDSDSDPF